jgi:hypothetical protein
MRRRLSALLLPALLVSSLALAACSDDDGDSAASDGADTASTEAGESGDGDGTCEGTDLEGTIDTGDATVSFSGGDAVAVSLEDGVAYTVYLADFDLDPEAISSFSNPEVAEGDTMFTLAATVFNAPDPEALEPIAVGDEISYVEEFGNLTIRVTAQTGEDLHGVNMEAEGTLTVTAVGDTFCGTVDYRDEEKTLTGTFEAPVKEL